ncbi:MAG: hypothetical protein RR356_02980 [Bacteroidales bacterium]
MKKVFTMFLGFFLVFSVNSQSIEKLQNELWTLRDHEVEGGKMDKAFKLLRKDPLNYSAILYITSTYNDRNIDSVSSFFDDLIKKHPNKVEPFLLRAYLINREYDYRDEYNNKTWKIKYLHDALTIDSLNKSAIYHLAKTYYDDFIAPLKVFRHYSISKDSIISTPSTKEKSTFEFAADSALKYLYKIWDLDIQDQDVYYFPIRQLECYLNRKDNSLIGADILQNDYCYFPSWYFANLSKNWECDFTIDYLYEIESSKEYLAGWPNEQLAAFQEPCLYSTPIHQSDTIFRFTWLRSFDFPICIRLEKKEERIDLFWKVGQRQKKKKTQYLFTDGEKAISENEWINFLLLFNHSDFYLLPNNFKYSFPDGASWILENKTIKGFKAHRTKKPDENIKACCLFLLKLTDIKIDENRIY